MSKLKVIRVDWVNDSVVHLYVGDDYESWWARPVPKLGGGTVWELNDNLDEVEGYYETPEDAFRAVSEKNDDAPVVVTRDRDQ